ncbi:hypothetical protein DICSQDRAFT_152388 [Dichomitus squalens LYAD-421 SS1]|uniref:uncharacterized protein n=1 Tax=Dichomitus squalens (strain LYAD-421) TaxID=732165 RepID=UPI0004411F31|nr:uncharacterized protein DICSQDRAFT_152388 [Dichomitus squalens LYAD-421 SS1]EJF65106.1 hypothetical protein DICSQDRAFT_152388 [Dichomitus squalens LYAD-421 SS1]
MGSDGRIPRAREPFIGVRSQCEFGAVTYMPGEASYNVKLIVDVDRSVGGHMRLWSRRSAPRPQAPCWQPVGTSAIEESKSNTPGHPRVSTLAGFPRRSLSLSCLAFGTYC